MGIENEIDPFKFIVLKWTEKSKRKSSSNVNGKVQSEVENISVASGYLNNPLMLNLWTRKIWVVFDLC